MITAGRKYQGRGVGAPRDMATRPRSAGGPFFLATPNDNTEARA